ncbi:NAD(P)H-binding protein [Arenibacter algicola]
MENMNNILVIGGTGKTGQKVVKRLSEAGHNVRIGSRSATPAFDWENPETWSQSMEGMDKVYITFQPDLAVPGALEAIEELTKKAKQSNVKKLVLLSGKGEREAELCEQVVIHSGLDYTIVRASWFNQNFSESFFLEPILEGFVALPQAEAKVPYVDTDDIADVAVAALLGEEHNGKIYQLTGPRQLTFKEVIQEISDATGRDIAFTPIALPAYTQVMKQQGVPADFVWLIEYLFSEVLGNPNNAEITHDIEKVLGRKPKDFSDYVKETAATGIWNSPSLLIAGSDTGKELLKP